MTMVAWLAISWLAVHASPVQAVENRVGIALGVLVALVLSRHNAGKSNQGAA